jgi:DNA topoisomerase-1
VLGVDPETGEEISLKVGRFGPYVQRGEGEKPARAGIPKGFAAESIDLETALKLLALPREVGLHPETGKPIMAGFGRFGPYLQHDGSYASLESAEDVFTVGINHAVTLLAERKERGPRGRRGGQALKELGAHPESGVAVKVMKGRYGPYVSDGTLNATLPNDMDPNGVTMDDAVALLAARAAKAGTKTRGKKGTTASAGGRKKAPAKRTKTPKEADTKAPVKPARKRKKSAPAQAE